MTSSALWSKPNCLSADTVLAVKSRRCRMPPWTHSAVTCHRKMGGREDPDRWLTPVEGKSPESKVR